MQKEAIIIHFEKLHGECKSLQKKLAKSNNIREKFYSWIDKRKKLEIIEDKCRNIDLDYFDKKDLREIMKVIYSELLQLVPPRKRKNAKELLSSSIASDEMTWEKLNTASSSEPLSIGNPNQCATCGKVISIWNIFSKKKDNQGNNFCSKKCLNDFYSLICDVCGTEIIGTYYYSDDEKKEGIICFNCAATKCSKCSKTIAYSSDYFQELLPGNGGKKQDFEEESQGRKFYSPICRNCQKKG